MQKVNLKYSTAITSQNQVQVFLLAASFRVKELI